MKKNLLLLIAALVVAANSGLVGDVDAQSEKPNIILIFCDDLGNADVGFNADLFGVKTDVVTPNIDAMARRGTIFKQA